MKWIFSTTLLSETREECEIILRGGEEVAVAKEVEELAVAKEDFVVERTPDKSADSKCFPLVSFFLSNHHVS